MISDNYVTGDNIYLRELQNFFFETLGMMSITHYGAIGDGRRDNYGPLQVAIDDAHRRGLSYLYVPYGRFIYTGELIHLDGITFVGNPHAKIVNIRTGEEIEIIQFGYPGGGQDLSNYYTKSEVDALLANCYTKDEIDALLTSKQDPLIAGDGIEIEDNVISATGGGGDEGVLFVSCPFPTSWNGAAYSQTDTATNEYGAWTISTTAQYVQESNTKIGYAFDQNNETDYKVGALSGGTSEVTIELPTDISICPSLVYVNWYLVETRPSHLTDCPIFYGYNPSTSEWESLATITQSVSSQREFEVAVNATKYYTKFKWSNINKTSNAVGKFTEFQIKVGKIKDERENPLGGE